MAKENDSEEEEIEVREKDIRESEKVKEQPISRSEAEELSLFLCYQQYTNALLK
jgi:hypothetical protein